MGSDWTGWLRQRAKSLPADAAQLAALALGAQVAVAAGVIGVDAIRKSRTTEMHQAPDTPPRELEVSTNHLTTYTYGAHVYDAMLTAINEATDYIYFASYIWKGDEVGQQFKDAFIEAANRGVTVCLVFDGFANLVVPKEFKTFPDNVEVLQFPTVRYFAFVDVRRTGRDHRKMLIVDGDVGFVGGYNIGSLYATQWRDTHVRLQGEAVWELENTFVDFWNRHKRRGLADLPDSGTPSWDPAIRAARNEPSRIVYPVRGLYLEAIDRATESIWITQAYFIPDREIQEGLMSAAARGVDVRVILPQRSNHVIADVVSRSYFATLLAGGVRLFMYQDAMVHAKTATVDGKWTTVGTANIDRLSLTGNYEVNLQILDREQAGVMQDIFRHDLINCEELTLKMWEERTLVHRGAEFMLKPLHPLL
ncbi:phosphatidylserine/phosphatidylglycerophosphate/cardiolipin synthase family protein [Ornithinimicrobium sp. Arc0846-15]|nr:phosphatidylserine/phosphatidylglycerophosphate/cardiolipin synthase family protein [Ornithinimicrobium laminariae]